MRARLDAARDVHHQVDEHFSSAAHPLYREFDFTFHEAVTKLEHAEWLARQGRIEDAQPLIATAGATFEQFEAMPWLKRVAALLASAQAVSPA